MARFEKKWLRGLALTTGLVAALMTASAQAAEKVKLGVIGGAEEEIAEVAKKVAATKGLEVELVTFSDYIQPNAALESGDLDANAFQHKPFLDAQIKAHGYRIVPIGFTIVEPIGLYSKKIKKFDQIANGAKIGIPNDPSNGARALRLLAAHGLIALKAGTEENASVLDIAKNPKKIKFIELEAPQLPRALDDFDAAVINTNYSLNGGFDPVKDALIQEPRQNNPYGNFIAVREQDKDKPVFKTLVAAYQSPEVSSFLQTRFKGAILPAW